METRHWVLMVLGALGERAESKTKIQKILYFISIIGNLDFGFSAYYYGPYSAKVEDALGDLTGAGFVDQNIFSFGIDAVQGFEKKRFDYTITAAGQEVLDYLKKKHPEENESIHRIVKLLKEENYLNLSIAAKAHFILQQEGRPVSSQQIVEKAKHFNWNISEQQIDQSVSILQNLAINRDH